jgi:trigger factor
VKSTVENVGPTRVKLDVEVPFEELKPSLDAAYKKIGSQVRIPGFRPGKVPSRIIDQRIGRAAVLEEAINAALPKAYGDAVRDTGVRALGQPEIEVTKLDDGQSLSFTAEVDVRPEITLPSLEGIDVSVDDAQVTEADLDEQLDALRDRFATLAGVDRPVADGDFVGIDLTATVDGQTVEAGSATNVSYEVGSGELLDGLDEALTGLSAGDSATFRTALQGGDHDGEQAEVEVTVKSVKEKQLPEADDEFAALASEFDTLAQLRDDLRERLGRVKLLEQGAQARDRVLERLLETVEFPLPESAVAAEVEYREHDVVHSLGHDDALFDQFLARQGQTRENFTGQLRESAQQTVKAQFVLDAIADAQQLGVADAELTEYLVRQAARRNVSPQEFAKQVVDAGSLPALMADVRRNKALASVLSSAVVTDTSGQRVDVSALSPAQLVEAIEEADNQQDDDGG